MEGYEWRFPAFSGIMNGGCIHAATRKGASNWLQQVYLSSFHNDNDDAFVLVMIESESMQR